MGPGMFDGLGSALALVSVFGVAVAGGIGYGVSYLTADDISFNFNKTTEAAIEENQLDARHVCTELLKGQDNVLEEFNQRGITVPTITMSMDECLIRMLAGGLTTPRP